MDNLLIGLRIKERRKALNLTGADIKKTAGISTGNLILIESGKVLPSSTALIGLSKILDCSVDWLLYGKEQATVEKPTIELSVLEEQLLKQFSELSEIDQEEILLMVQLKYNRLLKSKEKQISSYSDETLSNSSIA